MIDLIQSSAGIDPIERVEIAIGEQWAEALQEAYGLAKGERRGELSGKRAKRFDGRGLHPYSLVWGRIRALEEMLPTLILAEADPVVMARVAAKDAEAEFREQIRSELGGAVA
jgi:hypothetical protein